MKNILKRLLLIIMIILIIPIIFISTIIIYPIYWILTGKETRITEYWIDLTKELTGYNLRDPNSDTMYL